MLSNQIAILRCGPFGILDQADHRDQSSSRSFLIPKDLHYDLLRLQRPCQKAIRCRSSILFAVSVMTISVGAQSSWLSVLVIFPGEPEITIQTVFD